VRGETESALSRGAPQRPAPGATTLGRPSVSELFARLRAFQYPGGVRVPLDDGLNTDWYEVMLFPPADEMQVAATLTLSEKAPPPDLLEFWTHSNGANLFVNESGLHGIGLASTDLFLELQEEEEAFYGEEALRGYAVIARVNGAGDFLVVESATGRVLDGVHAEQPQEWRPIAEDFREWLERLIETQGRYFWLEALYAGEVPA
jgi:hypothetical protein